MFCSEVFQAFENHILFKMCAHVVHRFFDTFEKTKIMKKSLILLCVLLSFTSWSQTSEEDAVKLAIEKFFEGFHKQDTLALKQSASDAVVMQTISKDSIGNTVVRSMPFEKFVEGIASIPETTKFEERLNSFSIQVDGNMANAWTPYEFWINDGFSHCGVNSFQLVKYAAGWKIVYLIDTRRKENCK